jgi:hypothetical protein
VLRRFNEVPRGWFVNSKRRFALGIQGNGHGSRRDRWIHRNPVGPQPKPGAMPNELSSEWVVAYPRNHQRVSTEFASMKGKVSRSSTRLLPTGQNVPEEFSGSNNERFRIAGHDNGLFFRLVGYHLLGLDPPVARHETQGLFRPFFDGLIIGTGRHPKSVLRVFQDMHFRRHTRFQTGFVEH